NAFKLLAKEMGFDESAFQETEEEMIAQSLDYPSNPYIEEISYEALVEKQYVKASVRPLFPGKLKTPSGKIELYSNKMKEDGYPALPTYIPLVKDGDFPFLFVPAPNHNFLNSTFSNNSKHQALEKEPLLHMNQNDAIILGIREGDRVRVWNHRGECELKVKVGENVLPSVVVTQGLWENSEGSNQLVNSLTPDRLSDMGGGATFFSGRVNVEKIE
ncbi:MAG TPA: molybdopterin dinucleotide binding domain-containing protein, partial [Bacillus sp. (in: firmicutes)]